MEQSISQLEQYVIDFFTTNGTGSIEGVHLRTFSTNFLHSIAHKSKAGLKYFSSTTSYEPGDAAIYNGAIYQFVNNHQGAWNFSDVVVITNSASRFNFPDYENATNYVVDDIVQYQLKIYKCILNTVNVAPDDPTGSTYWDEVSAGNPDFGTPWTPALYQTGDVVRYNDFLYELTAAGPYNSVNIFVEIAGGDWKLIHTSKVEVYGLGFNEGATTFVEHTDYDVTINQVSQSSGLDTIEISLNGGSFALFAAPLFLPAATEMKWQITYLPTFDEGSINVTRTKS